MSDFLEFDKIIIKILRTISPTSTSEFLKLLYDLYICLEQGRTMLESAKIAVYCAEFPCDAPLVLKVLQNNELTLDDL